MAQSDLLLLAGAAIIVVLAFVYWLSVVFTQRKLARAGHLPAPKPPRAAKTRKASEPPNAARSTTTPDGPGLPAAVGSAAPGSSAVVASAKTGKAPKPPKGTKAPKAPKAPKPPKAGRRGRADGAILLPPLEETLAAQRRQSAATAVATTTTTTTDWVPAPEPAAEPFALDGSLEEIRPGTVHGIDGTPEAPAVAAPIEVPVVAATPAEAPESTASILTGLDDGMTIADIEARLAESTEPGPDAKGESSIADSLGLAAVPDAGEGGVGLLGAALTESPFGTQTVEPAAVSEQPGWAPPEPQLAEPLVVEPDTFPQPDENPGSAAAEASQWAPGSAFGAGSLADIERAMGVEDPLLGEGSTPPIDAATAVSASGADAEPDPLAALLSGSEAPVDPEIEPGEEVTAAPAIVAAVEGASAEPGPSESIGQGVPGAGWSVQPVFDEGAGLAQEVTSFEGVGPIDRALEPASVAVSTVAGDTDAAAMTAAATAAYFGMSFDTTEDLGVRPPEVPVDATSPAAAGAASDGSGTAGSAEDQIARMLESVTSASWVPESTSETAQPAEISETAQPVPVTPPAAAPVPAPSRPSPPPSPRVASPAAAAVTAEPPLPSRMAEPIFTREAAVVPAFDEVVMSTVSAEPEPVPIHAPVPAPPPPPVAPRPDAPAPPSAPEPEPVPIHAPVPAPPPPQATARPRPEAGDYHMVAPVELAFSDREQKVGIRPGTPTFLKYQRLAGVLTNDLKKATNRGSG